MCRSLPATAAEKAYKPIISPADTDLPLAQTRSSNLHRRTGSNFAVPPSDRVMGEMIQQ
jgi:hypothetical protein